MIAALALTSPVPIACRWYSHAERRCRDADVEYLGPWSPSPAPADWPTSYYPTPAEWGAYPLEQRKTP